jgi:SAM-dependent methyltransferase
MDLVVEAALWLNRRLPRRSLERRESSDAYAEWEYETGRAVFVEHFGAERLRGARVLDVACGPGGKTAWYAETADWVFGVDLDRSHLVEARRYGGARGVAARLRFAAADAVRLPLRDASVDAVTANDAMEHFADPAGVLAELGRVVRPGGAAFVTFPPYRSANGAHLYDYVRLPWCQVLLSRRALQSVVERAVLEEERGRGGEDVNGRAARIAREQLEFFDHALNGMTIGRFLNLVRSEPRLRLRRLRCVPPKLRWLEPVASLPFVREYLTGLAVAELERV